MIEIPLTRGLVALIDDADLPLVAGSHWYAQSRSDGKGWYARGYVRGSGRRGQWYVYMHSLLLPDASRVDHKNGDGLDNRRSTGNLRPATGTQNRANSNKLIVGSSHFKGVSWNKHDRRWRACIGVGGCVVHLGSFTCEIAAARAYNAAALEHWGEYARLNQVSAP